MRVIRPLLAATGAALATLFFCWATRNMGWREVANLVWFILCYGSIRRALEKP